MAEFRWGEIDASDEPGRPSGRHAWLRRVAAGLDALPDVEAETLAELATHLDDRTADEMAKGSSKRVAEQRAMDRLGDPATLGRELGRARVAGRSRLAVAAGGVLAFSSYTVAGTLLGIGLHVVPVWIVAIAAALLGYQIGSVTTAPPDGYTLTAALGLGLAWACGTVPVAMARLGARSFRAACRWVALAVVAVGIPVALLAPNRQIDLPIVVISLAIPSAAAVAALTARRSGELRPTPLVIGLAVIVLVAPTFIWQTPANLGTPATPANWDPTTDRVLASLVAPLPEGASQPECDAPEPASLSTSGVTVANLTGVKTNGWTDFRLQWWQLGPRPDGTWEAMTQILDAPYTLAGTDLVATYVPPSPQARVYYASLITAVDSLGNRHAVLVVPFIDQTMPWHGSAWGWLTGQP